MWFESKWRVQLVRFLWSTVGFSKMCMNVHFISQHLHRASKRNLVSHYTGIQLFSLRHLPEVFDRCCCHVCQIPVHDGTPSERQKSMAVIEVVRSVDQSLHRTGPTKDVPSDRVRSEIDRCLQCPESCDAQQHGDVGTEPSVRCLHPYERVRTRRRPIGPFERHSASCIHL